MGVHGYSHLVGISEQKHELEQNMCVTVEATLNDSMSACTCKGRRGHVL